MKNFLFTSTVLAGVALAFPALAVEAAPTAAKSFGEWKDGIMFNGVVNAGGTWNTSNPRDNSNFGRLIDSENGFLLNQVLLTAKRDITPAIKDYDFGFKLQGLYGSDARISRMIGLLEKTAGNNLNQVDITEANVLVHTPWLTDGGLDFKIGRYASSESAETIDASGNFFYSHSYIFNFGDPFYHTGVMAALHLSPMWDLYAGVDTGVNTGIGSDDNNDSLAFAGGIGFNSPDGKFTSLLSTHIGPEIADKAIQNGLLPATVRADDSLRTLTTLTSVWKYSDSWTFTNDLNLITDDKVQAGRSASAFGVAQYGVYKINDQWSVGLRGELYRDPSGAFVAQFLGNYDFTRAQQGLPLQSTRSVGGGKTTYGMITAGANFTPDLGVKYLQGIRFRPEVRYDNSFKTRAFNDSMDKDQLTFGLDVVLTF